MLIVYAATQDPRRVWRPPLELLGTDQCSLPEPPTQQTRISRCRAWIEGKEAGQHDQEIVIWQKLVVGHTGFLLKKSNSKAHRGVALRERST